MVTHKRVYFACFRFYETAQAIFEKYYDYLDVRRNEFQKEKVKLNFIGNIQEDLTWWYDKNSVYINYEDPKFISKLVFYDHSSGIVEILIIFDEHPILRELFFDLCEWFLEIFRISEADSVIDLDRYNIEFRTPLDFRKAIILKNQENCKNKNGSDDNLIALWEIKDDPWEKIPDKFHNRLIVKMWNIGKTCIEIAEATKLDEKTINNKIYLLRKKYGEEIVPKHDTLVAKGLKRK